MTKIFQVNKSFVDYITMMGFQHKHVDSEKQYYVNKKGNQFRIDYNDNSVSLLNSQGLVIDTLGEITNEQINAFSVYEQ